jgi:hypothetical protein
MMVMKKEIVANIDRSTIINEGQAPKEYLKRLQNC